MTFFLFLPYFCGDYFFYQQLRPADLMGTHKDYVWIVQFKEECWKLRLERCCWR